MGLWKTLSNDPKKLAAVSDFLTGFGSGISAGNKPGVSPLAALSMGFQGGTQGIKEAEKQRRETAYKDMQMQQLMAQHKANQAKLVKEQEALKRDAAFTQATQSLDPNSDTFTKDVINAAMRIGGTKAGEFIKNARTAQTMGIAQDKAYMERLLFPGKLDAQKFAADKTTRDAEAAARAAELHPSKLSKAESDAELAAYKAENPDSEGLYLEQPDGTILSMGGGDKVLKRKAAERWKQLNIADMEVAGVKEMVNTRLASDPTLIGIPGGFQEHASTALSGTGRMFRALGLGNVPVVENILDMIKKTEDLGWGKAAEDRIKIQSDLALLKTNLLDLLPARGKRLKSEVEAFAELVGKKETSPKLLMTRLEKLADSINDSIMYDLIANTWGSMSKGIKEGSPEQLARFPIKAINKADFVTWASKVPVSTIDIGDISKEKWALLVENQESLPDDWKRMVDLYKGR